MSQIRFMGEISNKQIILKTFITGVPKETDLEVREDKIRVRVPAGSSGVLVKNLYLSCDPYMRSRMRDFYDSYIPPFQPGSVITSQSTGCFRVNLIEMYPIIWLFVWLGEGYRGVWSGESVGFP